MKIDTLSLKNFRAAKNLNLRFHESLNVFVGVNGAGKSTILDTLAIMLSWAVCRLKLSGASGRSITESDIINVAASSILDIKCMDKQNEIPWKLVKRRRGYAGTDEKSDLSVLSGYTKQMQTDIENSKEKINLPLFVYYPVNRAVFDIPLRIRGHHAFPLFAAYDESLTSGANFRTFFEWFREREDLENENRIHQMDLFQKNDILFPDPQLEAVRAALSKFLPEFKNFTVRRSPLRMEVEKNGELLTVNQLSDGEKCLIALVGDLARRLAIANPMMKQPLDGEGAVMIDEIDLHLHPKWQRMVIPKLKDVFSNLQFVISTHSPHVITHVQPESLFLLTLTDKGIFCEQPIESYGKNVDRILEDLMGLETTRPDEISRELDNLFITIRDGKLNSAKDQISALRHKIGEDPELVKASVLIRRQESIGK